MHNISQKKIWIVGSVILAVLVALIFIVFLTSSNAEVGLNVSLDKSSYKAGEEIILALHLDNTGDVRTCISNMGEANIKILSFTRNGQQVETRSAPSYFIAPLDEILGVSLVPINPGENLNISLRSAIDEGLGGQTLRTTALDEGRGLAMFYNVQVPGNYELEIVYKYPGPKSSECPDVFKGETNAASVKFTVTP